MINQYMGVASHLLSRWYNQNHDSLKTCRFNKKPVGIGVLDNDGKTGGVKSAEVGSRHWGFERLF